MHYKKCWFARVDTLIGWHPIHRVPMCSQNRSVLRCSTNYLNHISSGLLIEKQCLIENHKCPIVLGRVSWCVQELCVVASIDREENYCLVKFVIWTVIWRFDQSIVTGHRPFVCCCCQISRIGAPCVVVLSRVYRQHLDEAKNSPFMVFIAAHTDSLLFAGVQGSPIRLIRSRTLRLLPFKWLFFLYMQEIAWRMV